MSLSNNSAHLSQLTLSRSMFLTLELLPQSLNKVERPGQPDPTKKPGYEKHPVVVNVPLFVVIDQATRVFALPDLHMLAEVTQKKTDADKDVIIANWAANLTAATSAYNVIPSAGNDPGAEGRFFVNASAGKMIDSHMRHIFGPASNIMFNNYNDAVQALKLEDVDKEVIVAIQIALEENAQRSSESNYTGLSDMIKWLLDNDVQLLTVSSHLLANLDPAVMKVATAIGAEFYDKKQKSRQVTEVVGLLQRIVEKPSRWQFVDFMSITANEGGQPVCNGRMMTGVLAGLCAMKGTRKILSVISELMSGPTKDRLANAFLPEGLAEQIKSVAETACIDAGVKRESSIARSETFRIGKLVTLYMRQLYVTAISILAREKTGKTDNAIWSAAVRFIPVTVFDNGKLASLLCTGVNVFGGLKDSGCMIASTADIITPPGDEPALSYVGEAGEADAGEDDEDSSDSISEYVLDLEIFNQPLKQYPRDPFARGARASTVMSQTSMSGARSYGTPSPAQANFAAANTGMFNFASPSLNK